jgi:hypothetical protein
MAAYGVCAVGAVLVVAVPTPHPIPYSDAALVWASSALLGAGGVVGFFTAWWGTWYVERAAALSCFGGVLVMLFETVTLLWPGPPDLSAPALTLATAVLSCVLFFTRWLRTKQQPYAPGRGPELPERQADKLLAHMVAEDREYRARKTD